MQWKYFMTAPPTSSERESNRGASRLSCAACLSAPAQTPGAARNCSAASCGPGQSACMLHATPTWVLPRRIFNTVTWTWVSLCTEPRTIRWMKMASCTTFVVSMPKEGRSKSLVFIQTFQSLPKTFAYRSSSNRIDFSPASWEYRRAACECGHIMTWWTMFIVRFSATRRPCSGRLMRPVASTLMVRFFMHLCFSVVGKKFDADLNSSLKFNFSFWSKWQIFRLVLWSKVKKDKVRYGIRLLSAGFRHRFTKSYICLYRYRYAKSCTMQYR